jgi:hypothetical protein
VQFRSNYAAARTAEERRQIASEIVTEVERRGGRFLESTATPNGARWCVVEDAARCVKKVMHALRYNKDDPAAVKINPTIFDTNVYAFPVKLQPQTDYLIGRGGKCGEYESIESAKRHSLETSPLPSGETNKNPGNVNFRFMVKKATGDYAKAKTSDKAQIIEGAKQEWLEKPGRFVFKDPDANAYFEIHDEERIKKIIQKLFLRK